MMQVRRLTGDILKKLSPGACRLLLAYKEEPEASEARYIELTGYSRRWVKALNRELQQAGAVAEGEATSCATSKPDQAYQALVTFGVKPGIARDLAERHAWETIQESIQYVRSRSGIANQAGYLVARLRERAKEAAVPRVSAVSVEIVPPVVPAAPAPAVKLAIASTDSGLPSNPEWQMLAYSVTVACGCDLSLNPAAVQAVQRLYTAGYTAEDVGYFLKAYWPTIWPGNSGEPPTLAALLEHIGHAKHLLDMAAGCSRGEELLRRVDLLRKHQAGECSLEHSDDLLPPCVGDPDLSPYATSGHPRFKTWIEAESQVYAEERQQLVDCLGANCPTCRRSRDVCICVQVAAIPNRIKDTWAAVLGQLQIQLNRATYDTWLRHLSLAGYADGGLIVETPNAYTQEWIERHLLPSMTRTFNDIYRGRLSEPIIRIRLAPKPEDPFMLTQPL